MTSNVSKELGLYNSKTGILKAFIYRNGILPPKLPESCLIEFDDLSDIPPHLHVNGLANHALISPIDRVAESNPYHKRYQLPLVLGSSITVHTKI